MCSLDGSNVLVLFFYSTMLTCNGLKMQLKTRLYELEWEFALADPDGTDSTSGLKENLDAMSKELDKEADQMQDREGLNQNLLVELQMVRHELEGVREELSGV